MNRRAVLVLVPLVLSACNGGGVKDQGSVTASGPAAAQVATVTMTDARVFRPNVVQARVGTLTLVADNVGGTPHNLVFDSAGLGHSPTIAGHSSARVRAVFTRAGTYTFTCTFHPGMDGRVVVT